LSDKYFSISGLKRGLFQKEGSSYTRQPGNASRSPLLRSTVGESEGNLSYAPCITLTTLSFQLKVVCQLIRNFYRFDQFGRIFFTLKKIFSFAKPGLQPEFIFRINHRPVDFILLGIQPKVISESSDSEHFANKPTLSSIFFVRNRCSYDKRWYSMKGLFTVGFWRKT
jgi:hypothetical protein